MYLRLRIAAKPTEPIAGVEGFAPFVSPIWSLTRLSHEWYIGGGFCSSGSTEGTGGAILTKFRNVVIELRQGRRLFFAMPNKKSTLFSRTSFISSLRQKPESPRRMIFTSGHAVRICVGFFRSLRGNRIRHRGWPLSAGSRERGLRKRRTAASNNTYHIAAASTCGTANTAISKGSLFIIIVPRLRGHAVNYLSTGPCGRHFHNSSHAHELLNCACLREMIASHPACLARLPVRVGDMVRVQHRQLPF